MLNRTLKKCLLLIGWLGSWMLMAAPFQDSFPLPTIGHFPVPTFEEATADFPREEKNLRKWDAPVVADLDQDGYLDLLLNDHGFGLRVCWNNNGRFAYPYDIIMGDVHGVTVGDFDLDGLQEIFVSRGGGSGSNARNTKVFRVDRERNFTALPDFQEPLALMRGRTLKLLDGDHDGDLDLLNFAFPSREMKGRSENYIYANDGQGQLFWQDTLPPVSSQNAQKTLLTDCNGDGHVDLLLYGGGNISIYQGRGDLSFEEVTTSILPYPIAEVIGVVELDFDNDGDLDLFLSRGHEFESGENFFDAQTETWGFFTKRGPFQFDDLEVGDILEVENFQSQWPHKDIYLGESAYAYEYPGETHSGRDLRLVNSDALGFPDQITEKGAYLGYVGNQKWRLAGDLWAPATGILHGVHSYPAYEHSQGPTDILLENRDGQFVDVTEEQQLLFAEHSMGVVAADLDNNGWEDILIVPRGELVRPIKAIIFLNQAGEGFKRLERHSVVTTELGAIGMAVETLDYDRDGRQDIVIGHERGKWHLFRNTLPLTEQAHFVEIAVGNASSGKATALGAMVYLEACGTRRQRRVGATGANYSLSANTLVHFGVGECRGPVQVTIEWTNGEREEQQISSVDQRVVIGKGADQTK